MVHVLHHATLLKRISVVDDRGREFRKGLVDYVVPMLYIEMLLDGEADDEEARAEFYQIIKGETDRVSRMIDNMLNISRIEAGIHSVERVETDFVAMTDDFKALAHDVSMHIAAAAPEYVKREEVPEADVAKEKKVQLARVIEVELGPRLERSFLAKVDGGHPGIGAHVDDEAAAPDIAGGRERYGQGEGRRHRGIDGVPARCQDIDPDLRGDLAR